MVFVVLVHVVAVVVSPAADVVAMAAVDSH